MKKYIGMIVLGLIVIAGVFSWFAPVRSEDMHAGCNSIMNYYNMYGYKLYCEVVFAECVVEGQQQSSIYNNIVWHEDVLGRFHGVVNGKGIVFGSFEELQLAVLNDGKNTYGFSHGFGGIYYWDEVEQRWLPPSETNERREAAKEMWRNAIDYMPGATGTK